MRRWVIVGLAGLALGAAQPGCNRASKRDDPVQEPLRVGDRLFLQRADPEQLQAAIDTWQAALLDAPDDPQLLGRLAMAYTLKAEGDETQPADGYQLGMEYGFRCLRANPSVGTLMLTNGGRVTSRVAAAATPELHECVTWTAFAWGRWLMVHGSAGAAIDLEGVKLLAERAVALGGDYDRGRPYHALGLALALPPEPLQPDRDAAAQALLRAMDLAPGRLTVPVDLAVLVYGPVGETAEFERTLRDIAAQTTPEARPDAPENAVAVQRAQAALEEGPRPIWSPDVPLPELVVEAEDAEEPQPVENPGPIEGTINPHGEMPVETKAPEEEK